MTETAAGAAARLGRLLPLLAARFLRRLLLFPVGGQLASTASVPHAACSYTLQLVRTMFSPSLVLRQVVGLAILQWVYEIAKWALRRAHASTRNNNSITTQLRHERDHATSYAEYRDKADKLAWVRAGNRIEAFQNAVVPRRRQRQAQGYGPAPGSVHSRHRMRINPAAQSSTKYNSAVAGGAAAAGGGSDRDSKAVAAKIDLYSKLMRQRNIRALMFHLRQDLLRGHGVGDSSNTSSFGGDAHDGDGEGECSGSGAAAATAGTVVGSRMRLLHEYRETVISALRAVAHAHYSDFECDDAVSVAERIAFFNETRHSFGRSALLLSGGATLGMYHIGLVKALFEQDLLPRVISGASAGSTVAALLGVKTDRELAACFEYENINTRFFTTREGDEENNGGVALPKNKRLGWWEALITTLPPPLPMLISGARRKFRKGYALDIRTLEASLRENCGDYTFQEAFDRTGRIVNIVVTPTSSGRMPMVLNYLTSPHVYLWSASLASCAVPGVFEPVELRARGIDGREMPYFPQGQKWSDGSVENDLPMQRLSELFNVNFAIVSQVNPHAMLFAGTSLGSGPLARVIQFLKQQIKAWILNVSLLSLQLGLPGLGKGLLPLLTQRYEGDVTIVPRWGLNDLFELFKDPSKARFEACRLEGQRVTWPKMRRLSAECAIERVMDKCTRELRAKLAAQETNMIPTPRGGGELNGGSGGASAGRQNRLPSFHTSLSLLAINDLDAGAPGPGGVRRRRPSFSSSPPVPQLAAESPT